MAQLEIHFPTGLIGHAGLGPDRPLVVGTHPQCDIVLSEPDVASVHCRIVWKRDGYWVEAAPNAEDVELNGRPVRSAPLASRDTLLLGDTRIVFDTADAAQGVASGPRETDGGTSSPYSDLWAAMDRGEAEELGPPVQSRTAGRRWWSRFKRVPVDQREPEAPPPGQERLLRSPLILGLSGTLLVLAVTGIVLWIVFAQVGGQRSYDRALEAMREELYAEAVRRFDRFLEDYPDHELAENARVLRGLCQVRRFSDGSAASPSQAVREAARMVDQVGHAAAFAPVQSQLGEILSRMARSLSAQAQSGSDKEAYTHAQQAMRLLESLAALQEEDGRQLQQSLNTARSAIEKAQYLEQSLREMQRSIDAGEPLDVYRRRDQLVRRYPDLAAEERIGDLLRRATELEREAITWQPGRSVQAPGAPQADVFPRSASATHATRRFTARNRQRRFEPMAVDAGSKGSRARDALHYTSAPLPQKAAVTDEPSGLIAAQTSFVVGSDRASRPPISDQSDPTVVFAIAGGALYAVDGSSGTVLWRRIVGHDVSFLPTLVVDSGRARALLGDARRNEVLLVEARTGELVWRQRLGEAFDAAPMVHQGRIFVATEGGSLVVLDAQSGRVQGHVRFPQPLAHAPVVSADGTRLYVAAAYASLYVLSANSLACDSVLYVGHPAGGIRARPLSVGEFLIVAENHTLSASRLHVIDVSAADGTGPVQEVALEGWVTQPPVESGRFVWLTTDAGTLYTFQISPARPSSPLALLTQSDHPYESGLQQYLLPWSERECFAAGAELRRYALSVQTLEIAWNQRRNGVPTQALQRQGNMLFAARRHRREAGIVLTALDARSDNPLWEIRLANGLAAVLVERSAASPVVVTQSGRAFRWTDQAATGARVLSEPFLTIEQHWLDAPQELVYDPRAAARVLGTRNAGRQLLVWTNQADRLRSAPHWIELPFAATAATAVLGQGILVPAADQRLYLLNADSGGQLAIPFQPPIDAQQPVRWSNPVVSQSGAIVVADTVGSLFLLEVADEPFDHLAAAGSRSLEHGIVSPLVALRDHVYFVDGSHNLHGVSTTDLSTVAACQLDRAAPVAGPWAVGDFLVVESLGREMVCLDHNGTLLWRRPFEDLNRTGSPLLHQGALWFIDADGTVLAVSPQDAKELWRADVHEPLTAGFVTPDEKLVVVSDDGTLNPLTLPALSP